MRLSELAQGKFVCRDESGKELAMPIFGNAGAVTEVKARLLKYQQDYVDVMLNEFDRSKKEQYLFADNVSIRCPFCPHSANGMGRVPEFEEDRSRNLDETTRCSLCGDGHLEPLFRRRTLCRHCHSP